MSLRGRPRVSYTSGSTSYLEDPSTTPRPDTSLSSNGRARTGRPRTAASTLGSRDQQVICAISESRGISPVVGLAFVNLSTTEAVLCQISDNQTFTRSIHKLFVYEPTELLFMTTAAQPKSKLFSIVEHNIPNLRITVIDRKYWSETAGLEYIQQLAFKQDVEAIKVSVGGNFYATCCIAAVLKYIELALSFSFPFHSLRIKYETSEGSMMIDLSTISSMELIQNLQNPKSKDCLFGLLNQTLTPMGSRLLKSLLLQPSTNAETLEKRFDALDELATREDIFFAVRQGVQIIGMDGLAQFTKTNVALKAFLDVDRVLTAITIIPTKPTVQYWEQSINNVIALKQYVISIPAVFEALATVKSELLLHINEASCFWTRYYIRIATAELEERNLPDIFINSFRKKNFIECQTLDLLKLNQKIADSHHEVLQMSDASVQELIDKIREDIAPLFKTCEAIALLDMIASFAQLVTVQDYCRPELTDTLAIKGGRHPIREKIQSDKFVPNDAYATQQSRFQIITGCNMSGKSTYIRSLALMTVMAQIGCFVPAAYASFPIRHQMFARISMDDSIEANVSTFASEMRETAFILRNIDKRSMVIVDELGRGTSTRDGLTIAIAIAEALIESRALVWFATHFRDLAHILSERHGVVNLHLAVDMSDTSDKMTMLYKITNGWVQETRYGIAMAKVAGLPDDIIQVAEEVSSTLARNAERQKKNSKSMALAKRRKLILGLREQLKQAQEGNLQGHVLGMWLSKLQDEFVRRMTSIDEAVERLEDEEIQNCGRESTYGADSSMGEALEADPEVVDQDETMGDGTSSEDADGLVQHIPGAARRAQGLYEMSGALPVE
ncbi:MAG: hypothetical protein Q9169_003851 [Polycauliona sp. 2 TL-2023]